MKKKLRSKWVTRVTAFAGAGLLALGATACSSDSPTDTAGGDALRPYKVGLLLGLTGSYSGLGELQRQAIELYVTDLNEEGGVNDRQIELTVLDSGSDEANAVNQLRKLATEDEVDIVIGPSSSGESIALKAIAASLKTPVLSLGASQNIVSPAAEASYMFKVYNDTKLALQAQMQTLNEKGWDNVALLSANNGYGQDAANLIDDIAADYDVNIVAREVFDPTATDVSPQLTKLGESDPEVVLVWAVNPANAIVAKSAAAIDFEPVLFHSSGAGSPVYIENAGAEAEGTLLQGSKVLAFDSMDSADAQYEATRDFVERFTAEYGSAPGQYEASAWDASILLENALRQIDGEVTDIQELRDALRDTLENGTKKVVGVNGIFTFTPEYHGQTGLDGLATLEVKDGKFNILATF